MASSLLKPSRSTGIFNRRSGPQRQEEFWLRAGLIAAIVFWILALLVNGIAYRKLSRAETMALAMAHTGVNPGKSRAEKNSTGGGSSSGYNSRSESFRAHAAASNGPD